MLKVLLVDDELLTIRMLQSLIDWKKFNLELIGYAQDGVEAYSAFLKDEPDIIITDIQMPNMTGLEFIKKVKTINKETEIILVSAHGDFSNIQTALKLGCSDYILKPIDEEELNDAIKRVLGKIDGENEQRRIVDKSQTQLKKLELRNYMKMGMHTGHKSKLEEFPFNFGHYHILNLEINHTTIDEFVAMQSIEALQMGYINRIMEDVLADYESIQFEFEENSWTILLSGLEQENLISLCQELVAILKNQFNINVKACFSKSVKGLEELPHQYKQIKLLSRYNFYLDSEDVLGYDYNCNEDDFIQIQSRTLAKELEDALEAEDLTNSGKILSEVFQLSKNINPVELDLIYEICFEIIVVLKKIISTQSEKTEKMAEILTISYQDLRELTSLKSLQNFMWQRIEETFNQENVVKKQYSQLVEDSLEILENHYNQSLSLEDICNQIAVSKNYFCYLFKREVGISLWQYLTDLRLKKAKELLLKTDLKSYEISFQVGYDNPSYFSMLFKKYESMTPNEYRKRHQSQILKQ
ncbi:response regulator transcription factor [Bacillus sp. B-jedd]|uniref:response regulator transcription factor n=1 Tax=Bacillus sp. B-jedd TaxID=1476857 RepID=UPI00051560F4|nr:response regulator [Bacillus sp. B-jedd]CEG26300.1 AraC family transcriptional regulator [Bacillus sp. B-jedd]